MGRSSVGADPETVLEVNAPVTIASPVGDAVADLGESPLWLADKQELHWVDVAGGRLFMTSLSGEVRAVPLTMPVSAVERWSSGAHLALTSRGFARLQFLSGRVHPVTDAPVGPTARMNDGAIDACTRCWAGSAVRDGTNAGSLFCLDSDHVSLHATGIGMSNGIDWSPGSEVMYHVDSTAGTITAWSFDLDTGTLGTRRVLRQIPPSVVDADGGVWVALWGAGQIWRLSPYTGQTTAVVQLPVPCPTSCAFGGPEYEIMFTTTAQDRRTPDEGRLFRADVGVQGCPPNRFRRQDQ